MSDEIDSVRKETILIVDDSSIIRSLLVAVLEDDYNVIEVDCGEEAIKLAESDTPPDLILLDVLMPEMSGYDACIQLKAEPRTSDIPVFFLSAMAGEANRTQGIALGAVDFLTKPIDPVLILRKLKIFTSAMRQKRLKLKVASKMK